MTDLCNHVKGAECWIRPGKKQKKGYSRFYVHGKNILAHRMAYWLFYGKKAPDHLLVCHKCDNPGCINPNHLFLGTIAQNNDDRNRKGRAARGSRIGVSKLTEDQVLEIRALHAEGWSMKALGTHYSLNPSGISRIINRKFWTHI